MGHTCAPIDIAHWRHCRHGSVCHGSHRTGSYPLVIVIVPMAT